jgi:WD40 repeat protein
MRRRSWRIILIQGAIYVTLLAILTLHVSAMLPPATPAPTGMSSSSPQPTTETFTEVRQIGHGTTVSADWHPQAGIAVGGSQGVWLYDDQFGAGTPLTAIKTAADVVRWSPDGTLLAVGEAQGQVYSLQVWDRASGQIIFGFSDANCYTHSTFAWGQDNLLATIDGNKVTIWNPRERRAVLNLHGNPTQIIALAWSPDGKTIAAATISKTIALWDTHSGNLITTLAQSDLALAVAWSPDSSLLASTRNDKILIWDVNAKQISSTLNAAGAIVNGLNWSGGVLASTANNDQVSLWNVGTAQIVGTLVGHTGFVTDLVFSTDGAQMLTVSQDNTVKQWDVASAQVKNTLRSHTGTVRALAWSPDGKTIAAASQGNVVQVWNAEEGTLTYAMEGHTDRVYALAWNPLGTQLASAGADGTLHIWDSASGALLNTLSGQSNDIRSLTWSPYNHRLASAGFDGQLHLWDLVAHKETLTILAGANTTIDSAAWSHDGNRIASSGQDGTVSLWNAATGDLLTRFKGHGGPVRSVVWKQDDTQLASAGDDGTLQIWNTNQHLASLNGHTAPIAAAAWRPHSDQIASIDTEGFLQIANATTGSLDLNILVGTAYTLAWSPDGHQLAIGGADTIHVFSSQQITQTGSKPMTTKPYRCIASALSIRTQPQQGDQYRTGQSLKFDDVVNVDESSRTESGGIIWIKHDRGWSAERSVDGKIVYLMDASLRPKDRQWGINIDPTNPYGNPPSARLYGLGWVRFVFHYQSKYASLDQAFAFYDPIIQGYQNTGTHVLLILLQDTYGGNHPWQTNAGWDTYITGFAQTAGQIAAHYKGQVGAYEIWNEGDVPASAQSIATSIYLPPEQFGPLLVATSAALKLADPAAKAISGGLASSDPVGYMTRVNASINPNGKISLPVDAIGIHPYGQTPPNGEPFSGWSQGSLGDAIARMADAFPSTPLWITEIGVPRVDVGNQAFWPGIANYMNKTFRLIRDDYFHIVPVIIWFAWADSMDNAGIVTNGQQPKGPIFDAFMNCLHADQVAYTRQASTPFDGKVMLTHTSGALLAESNVEALVNTITAYASNVGAVLVRSSVGASWAAVLDTKPALAIGGPNDLGHWAAVLSRSRIDLHAWHLLRGDGSDAEIATIAQAGNAPGVRSVIIDLDPDALQLRDPNALRQFMITLRAKYTGHLGVSFDSRPDQFAAMRVADWFPFANSWHPKVFSWKFSNGTQPPDPYFTAAMSVVAPYARPVIPMIGAEAVGNKAVPQAQIRQAAAIALNIYNLPAVSFWRLGAIGPSEFAAIQSVRVPWAAGTHLAGATPEIFVVQTAAPLRIRVNADLNSAILGTLQPYDHVAALEQKVVGAILWIRHQQGWSVARNGATGEIYLA